LFPWIRGYFSLDSSHEEAKPFGLELFYEHRIPGSDLQVSINQNDLEKFAHDIASFPQHDHLFETHYSVGHIRAGPDWENVEYSYAGDVIFAVDGVSAP
jgi:hypothetical protein